MMNDFIADAITWVVITSTPETQLLQVDADLRFTSLQTCVLFTDETAAIEYATENGWVPPDPSLEIEMPPEMELLPEPELP